MILAINFFIWNWGVDPVVAGGYKLLVVDDQSGVRRLLYETFIDEGYEVDTASGGIEALKKISAQPPDLILLDIKMPVMNGLATLREIRKAFPELTVVMMTAYGELDMLKDAKSLNAKHYLIKPFDLDEVRYLVKGLLKESGEGKKLQEII
ncbi:sporulation initiation phosphotransferase Spo0F [Desulfocucumis palustris]|uniref:Stage 0 sporulation protein A homolog n=1 Tax=Desulfocucumis palustris TaxID=1898651 RepID=A0A2L2XHF4_9FIRM|nr:response regulator [Desulfocucumis palustris]GBF35668.1 sporulation initiation phosphotransferase Spo0F [Desulfocucumis palustris]